LSLSSSGGKPQLILTRSVNTSLMHPNANAPETALGGCSSFNEAELVVADLPLQEFSGKCMKAYKLSATQFFPSFKKLKKKKLARPPLFSAFARAVSKREKRRRPAYAGRK
jgi:hypothetical protein